MSVNISLADTPGVSAFFDGQPLQDELEAEIRREEERQERELRDLLATELEDFEDDFLSDSNSDEDSVNVSHASRVSSHRGGPNEQPRVFHQAVNRRGELDPNSPSVTLDHLGKDQSLDSGHNAFFSPLSQRNETVIQNSHGMLQKQQNFHPQQHQVDHVCRQQQEVNYAQNRFIPGSEHEHNVQGSENVDSDVERFQSYREDNDDEWMMRVQPQAVAVSSASQYRQPPHHQQYFPTLPQPNSGVMENPSLPVTNHLRHQPAFHSPVTKSIPSQPSTINHMMTPTEAPPIPSSAPPRMPQESSRQDVILNSADNFENYQVQYKTRSKAADVNENDFYIQNENVEFFKADGGEEKRSYQQLEILYRARGRELEDNGWKLKRVEEDASKEGRMFKHKLALSNGELEGAQESLRHCQSLLQQSKADLTESQGLVKMLETQVTGLNEAKEELIKKLQVAESTIENLSHQCEELQQSESMSRARNEHEAVVSSLTQRYERELLSVKEKWDEVKTNLNSKHDEVVWLKKQLAESTKELEHAQISRGETINRLAKSLEDSQKQCHALLEQSSSQELSSLKVKLQQTAASKSISEDMCISLQGEIKELKEQLNMFESASSLGAFTSTGVASSHKTAGQSLDDSMTDLGIKKTLDFNTPHSTPQIADTSSLEELVSSLRSELERCLRSNRQKRSQIAEKAEEIQSLKQDLQMSRVKSQDLERTCANQKTRLTDLESLMSSSNGESLMEARLRRDLEAVTKEKTLLLEDIEDYKKRIEEVGTSEAKLTEINAELSAQIAQMVSDSDADKTAALDRCQRTLEEVHHMSVENMRSELEGRMTSEKSMLVECHKMELDRLRDQLKSSQEEVHSVKALYIQTCDEMKKQEEETRTRIREEVETELAAVSRSKEETKETALMQEEREKRICQEENFKKEKDDWDHRKELYEKEIKASKDVIAELQSCHEKDIASFQETISSLKSHGGETEKRKEQEEQDKLCAVETEWQSRMDRIEKQYKDEKEELEKLLQQERLKLEENSHLKKNHVNVSILASLELKDISIQTDENREEDPSDGTEGSLRERLAQIQVELQSTKEEHISQVENLKLEHRKEFEKAARNREEKFQTELRYFLKEKDDKAREKLEQVLRKCEDKHKLEMEQLRKELVGIQSSEPSGTKSSDTNGNDFVATSLMSKMMEENIAKLKEEKSVMERKIKELEENAKEEVFRLVAKHAKEEEALTEKYNSDMELVMQRHKVECTELLQRLEELEKAGQVSGSQNQGSVEEEVERLVNIRVQEERDKWFKDAQDYMKKEIEAGVKKGQSSEDDRIEAEVQRKVEVELSKIKSVKDKEVEEEINLRVKEKLDKEVEKLEADGTAKEKNNQKLIDSKVNQKLSVEIENLKKRFLSELEAKVSKEKAQLEQDVKQWKEEMKRKVDGDKELFVSRMNREVEVKVLEEKRKIEEVVLQCKEDELKEMRREMEEEMRKRIEKEKREWQKEWNRRGETEVKEMSTRDRLMAAEEAAAKAVREKEQTIELMRRRDAAYKEEKQKLMNGLKKFRQDLNTTKEEHEALESQYADMDKRYKEDMKEAKRKRELALEDLQTRADQEKEDLITDYKKRIVSMKEDFSNEMDKVRSDAEMERAALLMELGSHTERALALSPSLQEPDAETTTLFELRDHYLETVAKIKEDVMSHVQAANTRAASTLKTEMRKQRRRLVHVFKERCKASIRSVLTGQVPSSVLQSLDHSVDTIAEAMVTTPKSATSGASPTTPRSDSNIPTNTAQEKDINDNQQANESETLRRLQATSMRPEIIDNKIIRDSRKARHPVHTYGDGMRLDDQDFQGSQPLKSHPQLAKVDLYDSETAGSSPQTSAQSSPASITLHSKSLTQNSTKTHSGPQVPPLRLSPFQEIEFSEGQRYRHNYHKEYSNKVKHRPLSAESAIPSRHQNIPSVLRQAPNPRLCSNEDGMLEKESPQEKANESSASPRERMKMIEARVRLANWAASGEMPWKGSDPNRRPEDNQAASLLGNTDDKLYSVKKTRRKNEGEENAEDNIFVKPGKEAEDFLKAQRSMKRKDDNFITPSKDKRDPWSRQGISRGERIKSQHSTNSETFHNKQAQLDGYLTDDSNTSGESHRSFVTLEPDAHHGAHTTVTDIKGKDWATYTSDYDRIKAAVFDKSESIPNAAYRRVEKVAGSLGIFSDDDAVSVGSDDGPHFQPLPTSTPAKLEQEHYSQSKGRKSVYDKRYGERNFQSSSKHRKNEPSSWKTVDAFPDYPEYEDRQQFSTQGYHHYSSSKPKSSQDQREVAKSVDFEFPDISEITQVSDSVHVGRGMWRYKSLEELLPHHGKRQETDTGRKGMEKHPTDMTRYRNEGHARRDPPIQAMNSDFWTRQSLEDDDDDGKVINQHQSGYVEQRDKYSTHPQDQPHKHKSQHTSGHKNYHTHSTDTYNSTTPHHRQTQSKHSVTNALSEPHWSQRHHGRNTVNPPSTSSPSYTTTTRRNRSSPTSNPKPRSLHKSSYSPQFDAHVDELRKSLEELKPFSSKQISGNKSKMKRSVSEQSLHTLQWDNEWNPADIEDLVTAYTSGQMPQSNFDLHAFGNDEAF